jgi:hypothetical protein
MISQERDTLVAVANEGAPFRPLFQWRAEKRSAFRPLSSDRISNIVKALLDRAIPGRNIPTKDIRAIASSKLANIGVNFARIRKYGRWASDATFRKYYHEPWSYDCGVLAAECERRTIGNLLRLKWKKI